MPGATEGLRRSTGGQKKTGNSGGFRRGSTEQVVTHRDLEAGEDLMWKCKSIVALAAVAACCAMAAPIAAARPASALLPSWAAATDEDVAPGVERARAAGIRVTPEAARIMAQAPPGSCLASPTAADCPAVTAVVADNPGCKATAGRPSVAQADDGFLEAYAPGYSDCGDRVIRFQELYVTLYDFVNDDWRRLDTAIRRKNGGGSIGATARADCDHPEFRTYRNETFVYSEQRGTGYADTDERINDFVRC